MNDQHIADKVHEIRQRVIRIETRLVVLAKKMGVDLAEEEEIRFDEHGRALLMSLDIPLSTILKAARREEKWGAMPVVAPDGTYAGTLVVGR